MGFSMQIDSATTATQTRGIATVFDMCAEALLNEPNERIIADVQATATALSDHRFDNIMAGPELRDRYYGRFFVTSSPSFVALRENSLRTGSPTEGVFSYGPGEGRFSRHVAQCYAAVGFDYRTLHGFMPAVASLKADSLAAECAFYAYLNNAQALEEEQGASGEHLAKLARAFATTHLLPFATVATSVIRQKPDAQTGNDLYARICAFVRDSLLALYS